MKKDKKMVLLLLGLLVIIALVLVYGPTGLVPLMFPLVFAHCDTMSGPVVKAAQKALETGDPKYVLMWVKKKNEGKIEKAFETAINARKQNPKNAKKSDMVLFETLVRVHREGEGAPYEGIKPVGTKALFSFPTTCAADGGSI